MADQATTENNVALIKRVLRLSIPMAGSRLIQMLSYFIGMMMVAHLGHEALAASALMGSIQTVFIVIAIAILFAVSVVVGEAYGANRRYEIGAIVQQSTLLAIIITLPFALVIWFTPQIILLLGQLPRLVVEITGYFHVLALFTFPILFQTVLQQFAYGILKQRFVITINLINMVLFVPCAYFFIFGLGAFNGMGFTGLSWAWGIQDLLNITMLLWAYHQFDDFKQYGLFEKRSFKGLVYLKQLFSIGWPMSAQFGGELASMGTRTIFIGWIGVSALAASQITQQLIMLMIVPLFAMSESAGILVSQHKGAKQLNMIGRAGNTTTYVALVFCLLPVVVFAFFPHLMASLYMNVNDPTNTHTLYLVRYVFMIVAVNFVLIVIGDMLSGALRGLFDTRWPMWNGILFSWLVGVPLNYLFAFTFGWGIFGIFFGSTLMLIGRALGVILRWRWQLRRLTSA